MSRRPTSLRGRLLAGGWLALAWVLAAACSTGDVVEALEGAAPLSVSDQGLSLAATDVAHINIDAGFPTDLIATGDGGFAVLDGVRRVISLHASDGRELRRVVGTSDWGAPTRFAALDGGWLLTDPGRSGLDPGALVRVGPDGVVLGTMHGAPAPIALAIHGDALTVAGRGGQVVRCDVLAQGCAPLPGRGPGQSSTALADLVILDDGRLLGVAPLSSSVYLISAGGSEHTFGRYGHRIGSMQQPKSAAEVHGVVVVVDSALGTAQAFEPSGTPLGPLAVDGVMLRWEHPVAVRHLGGDRLAILDAATGGVTLASVFTGALSAARTESTRTRLRQPIPARDGGAGCLQCHDGFVHDGRSHADPAQFAHPTDHLPDRPLPDSAVLDEAGRVVCASCHATHEEGPPGRIPHGALSYLARRDRSQICLGCHVDTAHQGMAGAEVVGGVAARGHLVGPALERALARRPAGSKDHVRGDCLACHVAHGAASERLLRTADLGGTCRACHESHAAPTDNHPLGAAFATGTPRPGSSARLELDGEGGIGCGTCHDVIEGAGHALLRRAAGGGPVCLACHTARRPAASGPHGTLEARGGPACLACHDPHGSSREAHLPAPKTGGPAGCLSCHGPGGSASKASVAPGGRGHPVKGVGDGDRALAGCLTCHDAHAPTATPPCADCHAEQGAAAQRGGHGGATCVSCHPAHGDTLPVPVSARRANPASQRCLTCHAPDASIPATAVGTVDHPDDVFLPDGSRWVALAGLPLYGADGEPVPPGTNGALSCRSCHRVHGPEPGDAGGLLRAKGVDSCASCHGPDALPLFRWFHDPVRRARVLGGARP